MAKDTVPLKDYVDVRMNAMEAYFKAEIISIRQVVVETKSTYTSDKQQGNKYREQLKDQAATLATRVEVQTLKEQVGKNVSRVELWSAVGVIITIVVSLFAYFK